MLRPNGILIWGFTVMISWCVDVSTVCICQPDISVQLSCSNSATQCVFFTRGEPESSQQTAALTDDRKWYVMLKLGYKCHVSHKAKTINKLTSSDSNSFLFCQSVKLVYVRTQQARKTFDTRAADCSVIWLWLSLLINEWIKKNVLSEWKCLLMLTLFQDAQLLVFLSNIGKLFHQEYRIIITLAFCQSNRFLSLCIRKQLW